MELYIIRHAQSTNNVLLDQRQRVADPPLTDLGKRQAQFLAHHLATGADPADVPQIAWSQHMSNPYHGQGYGITRLICSPMWRSLQTVRPIAQALNLKPEVWVDIHEVGGIFLEDEHGVITAYGGKTRQELLEEYPDYRVPEAITEHGWWSGGLEEQAARDVRAIRVAAQLHEWALSSDRIAIVSHGKLISQLLRYLFNMPSGRQLFFQQYNAAISRLEFRAGGRMAVNYLNRADFLPLDMLS